MKVYSAGNKGKAICHRDGLVAVTFDYRDVPFSDKKGMAKDILVGVCDKCGDVVIVPAQSTPAIAEARKGVEHSLEVNLPSVFIELLDAASYRVNANATSDFRKRLMVYYINRYAQGEEITEELSALHREAIKLVKASAKVPTKRLSMKLSDVSNSRLNKISIEAHLNKTELIKSITLKIREDVVDPKKSKRLKELSSFADLLYA